MFTKIKLGFLKYLDSNKTQIKMENVTTYPDTVKEICEIVRSSVDSNSPISVVGMGTKRDWGHPVISGQEISLINIDGIRLYEPKELVMTAAAGTSIVKIKETLNENDQELAFEPPNMAKLYGNKIQEGTLGGMIACNLAGPKRILAGAARDHFLGFEAVNGRGEVFKSGGRVVKNVTGFDLSKLLAGSFGTLGIMTSISLKVLPKPEKTRTVLIFDLEVEDAVLAMKSALNSSYEVNAAAHIPKKISMRSSVPQIKAASSAVTSLRVQGPQVSVASRCNALQKLLSQFGDISELHTTNSDLFWGEVADVADLIDDPARIIWKVSVPTNRATEIASAIAEVSDSEIYFDWGGGLIWIGLSQKNGAMEEKLRKIVGDKGGHATLMRASNAIRKVTPVFQPQALGVFELVSRLKESFDPNRIINPGKMGENLMSHAD